MHQNSVTFFVARISHEPLVRDRALHLITASLPTVVIKDPLIGGSTLDFHMILGNAHVITLTLASQSDGVALTHGASRWLGERSQTSL